RAGPGTPMPTGQRHISLAPQAVPPLTPRDRQATVDGLLPNGSAAGAVLGWMARDLTGLKVGVALGTGASRAYAHLGVLRVLERVGVPIDYLAGTSAGAIVGC